MTSSAPGRMVGKGSVSAGGKTAAYAYILDCDRTKNASAPFEIRFNASTFRLSSASAVSCSNDPAVTTPPAGFDTQTGTGTGTLNGTPGASVAWKFVDGGTGGANDRVELTVRNASSAIVFQGTAAPPAKFPGSSQATGNNTAQSTGASASSAPTSLREARAPERRPSGGVRYAG